MHTAAQVDITTPSQNKKERRTIALITIKRRLRDGAAASPIKLNQVSTEGLYAFCWFAQLKGSVSIRMCGGKQKKNVQSQNILILIFVQAAAKKV